VADGALTATSAGDVVTLDASDVAVVDANAAGETPATVSLHMTWKGRGRRRPHAGTLPAFAGDFFRRARARGTFAATESGFAVAAEGQRPLRSLFAELGTERNGVFLPAAIACAGCRAR